MYPAADMESFQTRVETAPELVYRAFTRGLGLCEWLCNGARTFPKAGGMVALWWHSGYYTVGEFLQMEPYRTVAFSWHGRSEPHPTQVQVLLSPEMGNTLVEVTHAGLGNEEIWSEPRRELRKNWERGLENLKSVLETGKDLRVINRPGMGIYPAELSVDMVREHNFPVDRGIYLQQVIEGRGAEKAGLRKGDLVTKVAGSPLERIDTLLQVLSRQKMGSQIEIEFYRGAQKRMAMLELMPLPVPQVPESREELVRTLEESFAAEYQNLKAVVAGISEEAAEWKPALEEWSVKETLAHLIHTERDNQVDMHSLLLDEDFDWVDNTLERGIATIAAYPTIPELMEEVYRSQKETVVFLKTLPPSFLARKGSYWKVAQNLLTNDSHLQEHIGQIKQNLEQMAAIKNK